MIDDEVICTESMQMTVTGTRYNLNVVNNHKETLKLLSENYQLIDLILLDLMMPDIYGLDLLQELKENEKLKNIPVILYTGTSDSAEIDRAYKLGIIDIIKKPCNKNEVFEILKKIFQ